MTNKYVEHNVWIKKPDDMDLSDLRWIIKDKGMDWAIAAIIDGSIGYYSYKGAKLLLEEIKKGKTTDYSERCYSLYGGNAVKMVAHDFRMFKYKEEVLPDQAKANIEFANKMGQIKDEADALTVGLLYPTLG